MNGSTFRDENGYITTFVVVPLENGKVIRMRPRYTMFGQWRARFIHEYFTDIEDVEPMPTPLSFWNASRHEFILPYFTVPDGIYLDELDVRVGHSLGAKLVTSEPVYVYAPMVAEKSHMPVSLEQCSENGDDMMMMDGRHSAKLAGSADGQSKTELNDFPEAARAVYMSVGMN
jgi:hypothetical protein